MKKRFSILIIGVLFSSNTLLAQLSVDAQRIYDSCIANNPGNVNYALSNGVQVISTPDSNSFYLQWFPSGATPNTTPLLVTLHGSKGNAFNEFKSWHTSAQSHNCGIIAIQYNKYTNILDYLNGYFHDDTIYRYIDSALSHISYPSNKALLHGFSLGSARTYAVVYNDIQSGKNYFCTSISNAGKIDLTYPLYAGLDTLSNVFAGKHWNLFCGPPETIIAGDSCGGLDFTQSWLQGKGAIIDIYIKNPSLGHNGFQQPQSEPYKDTMLNKYLECYNTPSPIRENFLQEHMVKLCPNPFSTFTTLQTNRYLQNASFTIFNSFGQVVRHIDQVYGNTLVIHREELPCGLYFIRLTQENQVLARLKIRIAD